MRLLEGPQKKIMGSLSLAIFSGHLINYVVIRPQTTRPVSCELVAADHLKKTPLLYCGVLARFTTVVNLARTPQYSKGVFFRRSAATSSHDTGWACRLWSNYNVIYDVARKYDVAAARRACKCVCTAYSFIHSFIY